MSKRDQKKLRDRVAIFLQRYGRKSYPNFDPNDRSHDQEIEKLIRHMDPEELDRLMNDDETGQPETTHSTIFAVGGVPGVWARGVSDNTVNTPAKAGAICRKEFDHV